MVVESTLKYTPKLSLYERLPALDDRIAILLSCSESELHREKARRAAKDNTAWFINAFCYTFDPRPEISDLPFFLYPFQVDVIDWLESCKTNQKDGLVEKSRDMGMTWTYLAYIVHHWLFEPGFHVLLGSRKEEMVDNFTEKSLFGRLEYIIRRLPGWLLPKGFNMKKHRRERRIINPENGNEITGEATNKDFGRQGRYSMVFFDEAAMWDNLNLSWGSASASTPTRIAVSTPNRAHPQNYFYYLRNEVVKNVLTLPWDLHPLHDEAEWQVVLEKSTPEEILHEYQISYVVSSSGLVFPSWKDVPKGHYPYQPGWELYTSWDFGIRDTSIIWWQRNSDTGEIYMIDSYQGHEKAIDFYIPFITGVIPSEWPHHYEPAEMKKINEHGRWGQPVNYGDPAGNQRGASDGKSPIAVLADKGVYINTNASANDLQTRKDMTVLGLRKVRCHLETCAKVDAAMTNARYPAPRENSQSTAEIRKPVHDWTSHFRTAVEFFFVNIPEIAGTYSRPAVVKRTRAYQTI